MFFKYLKKKIILIQKFNFDRSINCVKNWQELITFAIWLKLFFDQIDFYNSGSFLLIVFLFFMLYSMSCFVIISNIVEIQEAILDQIKITNIYFSYILNLYTSTSSQKCWKIQYWLLEASVFIFRYIH